MQIMAVTATIARLIRLVIRGEEILITQAGHPVARLVGVSAQAQTPDRSQWLQSLQELRESTSTGSECKTSDEILSEDRDGRE